MKNLKFIIGVLAMLLGAGLTVAQQSSPSGWGQNNRPTDGLFAKVDMAVLTAQQEHYLNTIKSSNQYVSHEVVQVNIEQLRESELVVLLSEGSRIAVNQQKLTERGQDNFSWFGKVEDYPLSSVNIVVNGDMVSASFRFGGDLYRLWPLGEGLHAWTQEDGSRFIDHNEDDYKNLPSYDMKNGLQESRYDGGKVERYIPSGREILEEGFQRSGSDCKIRLLVAYTDDVAAELTDPRGEIQLAIDNYNNSSSNSEVNFEVEVARILEVNYAESGSFTTDRNRFRNTSDGFMDNIHDLRSLYDADYCQLVVSAVTPDANGNQSCGLAMGIGVTYNDAFCVSRHGCIVDNLTFAHEFAHLHGCRHDEYVDSNDSPFSYGHGHVNVADNWRTVMSYNNECRDSGTSCTRIQWWSTPDVNVTSSWGSDPAGVAGESKNEAALDNTEVTVAGWEAMVTNKSVFDADVIDDAEEGNFEGLTTLSTPASTSTHLDYRNGSKGYMKAGDSVTLREGFWARSGSEVSVYLESCNVVSASAQAHSRVPGESQTTEISVINKLTVAPNPFRESLKISLDVEEDVTFNVFMMDAYGKVIMEISQDQFFVAGVHQFDLDAGELSAGYYMLVVQNQYDRMVKQIIRTD